jgi:hypothetical protein
MGRSQLDNEQLDHDFTNHADVDAIYVGGPTGSDVVVRNAANTGWVVRRDNVTNADPGVGDDSADGYLTGSRWINSANNTEFVCVSAAIGAAVWVRTSNIAGGTPHTIIGTTHTDTVAPPHTNPTQYDELAFNGTNWTARRNNVAATVPTVNDDITQGYTQGSWWVETVNGDFLTCIDATAGAAQWRNLVTVSTLYYSQSLGDNSNSYVETNNTAYTVMAAFSFDGTANVGTPNHFEIVASRSSEGGGSSGDVRLWDATNSLEVALINYTAAARTAYDTSIFTNLPAGPVQLELQARRNGNGRTQVWFAELARL